MHAEVNCLLQKRLKRWGKGSHAKTNRWLPGKFLEKTNSRNLESQRENVERRERQEEMGKETGRGDHTANK